MHFEVSPKMNLVCTKVGEMIASFLSSLAFGALGDSKQTVSDFAVFSNLQGLFHMFV